MLDWQSLSTATRVTMLSALGALGIGLIFALVGVASNAAPAMWVGIVLMGLGILAHLVGFGLRMRDARKNIRNAAAAARKGKK